MPDRAASFPDEFASIADAAPAPMWVAGLDGRRVYVNRAYAAFAGVPYAAALEFDWHSVIHPDDAARLLQDSLAGEASRAAFEMEGRYRRADGEWRWLRSVSQPHFDATGRHIGFIAVAHDVTEAKSAELAMREREQQLTAVFDQTAAGLVQVDLAGRITRVNKRFCAIVGRPRDELMRLTLWDITHPDDIAADRTLVEAALASDTGYTHDKRYLGPDGAPMWVHDSVSVLRRSDGQPYGLLVVAIDITDRHAADAAARRSEAALRDSEQKLRLAIEGARIGTWELDLTNGKGSWSDRTADIMGVPPGTPLSARQRDAMIHPDDRARVRDGTARLAESGTEFHSEYRIVRPDGAVRWIASHGMIMRDAGGAPTRAIGTLRDVTERREAQEQLGALNRTLEQQVAERTAERDRMWRMSRDLLLVIGRHRRVLSVNPAIHSLGYAPEEVIGRPLAGFIHPDDWAATSAAVRAAAYHPIGEFHARLRARDGEWRCIAWTAAPGEGEAYVIGRDVTAETLRRNELAQAQEALRQAQKMESLGQLTGGVAHDFNNLLTPIIGNLDLLQRQDGSSERQQRLVRGALESAERARLLVQRLLAFARRQPLQPGAVAIGALFDGLHPLIASTVGPQVRVVVNVAADMSPAMADANQLELALLNLAVNARDAMPEGGTLTLAAFPVANPPDLPPGGYVALSVADSGHGMDAETMARAAEPFFSTKGVGKGTGLGLSMVHGLASQLGGAMRLDSRPGQGTRVALLLPVADAPAAPSVPEIAAPADQAGRVLLVDDEPDVRAATADMLESLGFTVATAGSGAEALGKLAARPDVLVTDHLMPGMTGADLAVAARARRPDLKILVISGYAGLDQIPPDLPRLSKPFRLADLAQSLARL
ncbi:PAS domain S-box protein [uncultured Sphingomonas sp.]|uniref:PAS domain S-box protein n=1 Tax=uncultured Sphingomonas sp. TaxID=158754 RepID=UPI0035CC0CE0